MTNHTTIRGLRERIESAWNRVPSAETVYHDGDELRRAHRVRLNSFPEGNRPADDDIEIHRYGADTAVVTRGESAKGQPSELATHTVVRDPGIRWRTPAGQKAQRKPLPRAVPLLSQSASRPGAH
ncbi:hypothetical protein [Nocardia sp. NPDC019302]|uniref:hypothetical protein n=1 Tax=Nocardia sp. NPDC019302 TaxID=3154592 RepID=UPI0033DCA2D1